ncbi:hypothetical protein [Amycolatopsis pithecellobii]|uniref:hypothetical protein n=1 Tax=Amycolatopsis pithecellobii TaxID=664692 RepID=UPI0028AA09A6|nr:hypothetical protein [Amycolatopsis pithecellobii]
MSASVGITPHGPSLPVGLVLASAGKAISQNNGLAGGYPGNSGREVITRDADVTTMLANGVMPVSLDEFDGNPEVQPCYGQTYVAPGEVFSMFWQCRASWSTCVMVWSALPLPAICTAW